MKHSKGDLARSGCRSPIESAASAAIEALEPRRLLAVVSLALTDGTIGETGSDSATFTITRDTSVGNQVVRYRVGGSASPADYTQNLSGSITIPAGSLSTTITVTPVDDAINETHETLTISLEEPDGGGYTLGTVAQATVRITENDVVQGVYRQVGPGKTYATPSAAFAAANPGDYIDIYPDSDGMYTGDFANITDNNLTVRGIGEGRVKVHNVTSNLIPNGKGIWVFNSGQVGLTIENFDFQGARVIDGNGAGLRLQGEDWTVRNCYFFNNENGILSSSVSTTNNVLIEYSEFYKNGLTTGFGTFGNQHNVYISGSTAQLTFQYNFSHDSNDGHLLKTRADKNYILYNRFNTDVSGNYEINVPEGGQTYIIGNVIRQSSNSPNGTIIDYGSEGGVQATDFLYVVNNTIVNTRSAGGNFISAANLPSSNFNVTAKNNIFAGPGVQIAISGAVPTTAGNYANTDVSAVGFVNSASFNYHLLSTSPALNAAVAAGVSSEGYSLTPTLQYVHRSAFESRFPGSAAGAYAVNATVVNRRTFYNQSKWDGTSLTSSDGRLPDASDDAAIATDKVAYFAGGGAATKDNITNYNKGINGIIIDFATLPANRILTAADFTFRTGNSNTPSSWTTAQPPFTVLTRPGAGINGSTRVHLVWEANDLDGNNTDLNEAVAKGWLEVTVLANANTALASNDVFYFGNAVGDTFDSTLNTAVNATDELGARNNPKSGFGAANMAAIDFVFDFNRDRLVNVTDQLIARNNPTNSFTNDTNYITIPLS